MLAFLLKFSYRTLHLVRIFLFMIFGAILITFISSTVPKHCGQGVNVHFKNGPNS